MNCRQCCNDINNAAKFGHFECLKELHQRGHFWNDLTCEDAASNGHLGCLKYLYGPFFTKEILAMR